MGLWKRLFACRKSELDDMISDTMSSIERNATLLSAPHDHELWELAQKRKGHIFRQGRQRRL